MKSGLQRTRCGLAETADRGIAHRLAHLPQCADFACYRAKRPALDQRSERLLLANGAHAAGNTLAAGFMSKKGCDTEKDLRKIDRIVKRHDDPGPQRSANRARAFEGERGIELLRGNEGTGRSS